MKYAAELRPDEVDWDNHIALSKMLAHNEQLEEMERVKAKKDNSKVTLIVAHETPDAAGTGVVAAHRVREANKRPGEFAYYVFPDPQSTSIQEGYVNGCPVIGCPPTIRERRQTLQARPHRVPSHIHMG
jgi:hypothetical protein